MAAILDGRVVARSIRESITADIDHLARWGAVPSLHVILVGEDPASQVYVASKEKACREMGMGSEVHRLPATTTREELLERIDRLNGDPEVDGILVQLPLPSHMDEREVTEAIDPTRDADGFHPSNVGLLWSDGNAPAPCTPSGIMEMLRYYAIDPAGKRAVIIGRSNIVGKPMAALLIRAHATVTICHSRTRDLPAVAREADILVVAIGRPGMVDETYIRKGAVVIDVGVNRLTEPADVTRYFPGNEKKQRVFQSRGSVLIGDVWYDRVFDLASAITPVPGGVGPLTISMLLKNTVAAARRRRNI